MSHLEFAEAESLRLIATDCERWLASAERLAGHDLDGNQLTDGYSLDYAVDAWRAGKTPAEYVGSIA